MLYVIIELALIINYTNIMTSINWTKIYSAYQGKWVALNEKETTVLGSGKTAKEALVQAQKKGFKQPILTKIPKKVGTYVGQF